jgi:hypothetical protein
MNSAVVSLSIFINHIAWKYQNIIMTKIAAIAAANAGYVVDMYRKNVSVVAVIMFQKDVLIRLAVTNQNTFT